MNPASPAQAVGAPLIYGAAVVLLVLGAKALTRVRAAGRATPLLLAGAASALVGAWLEGSPAGGGVLGALAAGAVAGALAALRLPATLAPARAAWIPALGGLASAVVAATVAARAGVDAPARAVASIGAGLGGAGALAALLLALRGSPTARASAAAALSAALSGWATACAGFVLENALMLIVGGLAGAAALALARIVAEGAGQPVAALLAGAPGATAAAGYRNVRSCGVEEAAMVLESSHSVLLVPGFGMALARAQSALKEMADLLEQRGARVRYIVHPVAGCVPGHMNVALDEAGVPHDRLIGVDDANAILREEAIDTVVVVGANDVVNPVVNDVANPLYGLGALDLSAAHSVFVVKRSLRPGAAGVANPLFERPGTTMIFGDAKRVLQGLVAELKGAGAH